MYSPSKVSCTPSYLLFNFYKARLPVCVVVQSPQTPEDDPEKRLRTRSETCKFVDGLPKTQSLAVHVKGGTMEQQVVVGLIFIIP